MKKNNNSSTKAKWLIIVSGILIVFLAIGYFLTPSSPKSDEQKLDQVSDEAKVVYNVYKDKAVQVKLLPQIITTINFPDKEKIVQKNILFADEVDGKNLKKRAAKRNLQITINKNSLMIALLKNEPTTVVMTLTGRNGDKYIFNLNNAEDIKKVNFIVEVDNVYFEALSRIEKDGKKTKNTSKDCDVSILDNAYKIEAPTQVRKFGNYILMRYANDETVSENFTKRNSIIEALITQEIFIKAPNSLMAFKNKQRFENLLIINTKNDILLIKKDDKNIVSIVCNN